MMTIQTKWLLAIAGVACVGGTGAWLYSSPSDSHALDSSHERAFSAGDQDSLALTLEEREPGCRFAPGMEFAYRVATEDVAELDLSGLPQNLQAQTDTRVRATTTARLELRTLSTDPQWGSLFVARFAQIRANTIREEEKLHAPFLVRVASDCSIDGFAYKEGTEPGYARVQQALLHELSWSWPAEGESDFEARNTYGTFLAGVRVSQEEDNVAVAQAIKSFIPWSSDSSSVERVRSSHQRVLPGQVAWFHTLEASSSFVGPRSQVQRTTRATFLESRASSLEEVPTEEADYVWADLLPHEIPLHERQPPTEAELRALAEARKLTVDEALDQYVARTVDEGMGIQDTWPPLQTFLEARPDAAEELIERMKRRALPSEATMGAYIALGNARTPEARRALEGVMRDENAPVIERSRAVLALIDRSDVGIELAGYLSEQSQGLVRGETPGDRVMARQSLLALGAMSGRKGYDQEIKRAALSQIGKLLEEAQNESAAYQRPIFGALANVGDVHALSLVAHIPTHRDPDVREAAAIVFRRMPAQQSADFAAQWLAIETDWNVKRRLWQTIELQTFDLREMTSPAVLELAVRDLREKPGFITRKALIRLLGRALETMPKDELGIEDVFAELIPFEFEQDSGFYAMMHDHIEPERREAIYMEVARSFDGSLGPVQPPSARPTTPDGDDWTNQGLPDLGVGPAQGETLR